MTPAAEQPDSAVPAVPAPIGRVLWECALGAAVNAFLVLLLGSIAFGIVNGIWRDMTPSLPPGFSQSKSPDAGSSGAHHAWHLSAQTRFLVVFAILFSVSVWARLGRHGSDYAASAQKLGRRISHGWFGLIVGNAFGAMVAAIVVCWVQKFSLSQLLFQWVWSMVWVPIQTMFAHVFGDSGHAVEAWFNWYGANQFRFSFWFLYVTAICDDLGLPNFKTGTRLLWRRWRKRRMGAYPASGKATSVGLAVPPCPKGDEPAVGSPPPI